jgi:nicotinate-nucleotide adenylyltransferase
LPISRSEAGAVGGVGVLGGAFNPPHLGHLALAKAARDQLALDRVLLVTTGRAPHKAIEPEPGPEVRLGLTRRAVEGLEGIEASDLEVERDGPSYMYETLETLTSQMDGVRLWLICGSDIASTLPRWERPERVVELAGLAVAPRPGTAMDAVVEAVEPLGAGTADRLTVLDFSPEDVSSTEVRRRCAAGESIDDLVPFGVSAGITARGLYR